jgi:hypothetical protein
MLQFFFHLFLVHAGPTCKSISLEGGGSHGAYEAGVVWALVNLTSSTSTQWNIISGISAGALNTAAMIQFPLGQEQVMSDFLLNLWLNVNGSDDFYVNWKGGVIDGLLFHGGIYDYSPINSFLRKTLKNGVQRNFTVGSTNLDTGLFSTFNESLGAAYIDAVISSASPPFFFQPHLLAGFAWADGGCIVNLDVFSAIERCLQVTDEKDVVVDMVFDNPYSPLSNLTSFKTPEVFSRIFGIRSYDSSVWYSYNAQLAYPDVQFRYVLKPSGPMPGGIVPLNFTPSNLNDEIQLGINDTRNYLKQGKNGRVVIQELYQELKGMVFYPE